MSEHTKEPIKEYLEISGIYSDTDTPMASTYHKLVVFGKDSEISALKAQHDELLKAAEKGIVELRYFLAGCDSSCNTRIAIDALRYAIVNAEKGIGNE